MFKILSLFAPVFNFISPNLRVCSFNHVHPETKKSCFHSFFFVIQSGEQVKTLVAHPTISKPSRTILPIQNPPPKSSHIPIRSYEDRFWKIRFSFDILFLMIIDHEILSSLQSWSVFWRWNCQTMICEFWEEEAEKVKHRHRQHRWWWSFNLECEQLLVRWCMEPSSSPPPNARLPLENKQKRMQKRRMFWVLVLVCCLSWVAPGCPDGPRVWPAASAASINQQDDNRRCSNSNEW